jgi:hypothetical protein
VNSRRELGRQSGNVRGTEPVALSHPGLISQQRGNVSGIAWVVAVPKNRRHVNGSLNCDGVEK